MGTRSAGLLLWRRRNEAVEVLLGHPGGPFYARKDDGVWTVPKGEHDPGESPVDTAYREFGEELGVAPLAGEPVALGEARQAGGKTNAVWALEGDVDTTAIRSNTFSIEWPPRSGQLREFPEIDRVGWFDLPTARVKIRAGQLPFLDRLSALLETRY